MRAINAKTIAYIAGILAVLGVVAFVLFILGAMTALFPSFVARLVPIFIIPTIMLFALFSRNKIPLPTKLTCYWLIALLAVFSFWPTYMIFKVGGLPSIDGRKLFAGFSFLALIYLLINKEYYWQRISGRHDPGLKRMFWLITAFIGWRILTCITSPAPVASILTVGWEVLFYYGFYFVVLGLISEDAMEKLPKVFLYIVIVIALFALFERATQKNPLLQLAPRLEGLEEFAAMLQMTKLRDGVYRAQATFEHPLVLAEFMSMGVCMSFAYMLWHGKSAFRGLCAFILILCVASVRASGSRSGYLASAAGMAVIFGLWFFRARTLQQTKQVLARRALFISTLLIGLALAMPALMVLAKGKTMSESTSTEGRVIMLKLGLTSIQSHPLEGTGPGSAGLVAGIKTGAGISTLDNFLLALAVDSGIPALLLFLGCLIYPAWRAVGALFLMPIKHAPMVAGTVGCVVVVLIARLILWMPYNLSILFIFIALTLCATAKPLSLLRRQTHAR